MPDPAFRRIQAAYEKTSMKKSVLVVILIFVFQSQHAQSVTDFAVRVSADVQNNPARIILNWPAAVSNSIIVYRKYKADNAWGSPYAILGGGAVQFTDTAVLAGIPYEYKLMRQTGTYNAYGYVLSGIEVDAAEERGILLLLIDDALTVSLQAEIATLQDDLESDGWRVKRFDLSDSLSVDSVKALIVQQYSQDTAHVKALFLLGHLPVPYSGNLAPDGHSDHLGAWPADVFYGDMNGTWTDATVNTTTASDPRNDNIPGDGKYDQSAIPSDAELQVGRVDFRNLPAIAANEETLLRRYLNRNHAFRQRQLVPQYRAVVDDNFGTFYNEAFAASAYKNFSPLVGTSSVIASDYRTALDTGSYIWSYGCGGGSHTSCSGVGTTADLAGDSLQTIFTMLFGSYFGDWDRSDNLMRTALASGTTLSISWSGRPHWVYHHMGLGENIGYDARLSQNNTNLYFGNNNTRGVHVALLGDPSLRMHYTGPPSQFTATIMNDSYALLSWMPSADSVLGYHVYRRSDSLSAYARLNANLITGFSYADSCLLDSGVYQYMVKAVKLEVTPSGSYFNTSTGARDTAWMPADHHVQAAFTYQVLHDTLYMLSNTSSQATSFLWNFGDGSSDTSALPVHVYSGNGNYFLTLWAFSDCDADSLTIPVSITTGLYEIQPAETVLAYPNPAKDYVEVTSTGRSRVTGIQLFAPDGRSVSPLKLNPGTGFFSVAGYSPGLYLMKVYQSSGPSLWCKLVLR